MTLKQHINARGLSVSFIEREAGIPSRTLYSVSNGTRMLPIHHMESLVKVLKKHGIKPVFNKCKYCNKVAKINFHV